MAGSLALIRTMSASDRRRLAAHHDALEFPDGRPRPIADGPAIAGAAEDGGTGHKPATDGLRRLVAPRGNSRLSHERSPRATGGCPGDSLHSAKKFST